MYRTRSSALLAGVVVLFSVTQAVGQQVCRPALAFENVRFSQVRLSQRVWTASLAVDASRCATVSGRFDINFIRLKETGPDLPFTEQFTWRPGQVDVSVDFPADEAVLDYSIGDIASCACRE